MALILPLSVLLLAGLGVVLIVRHSRARALRQLRQRWGRPIERERKFEAIEGTHRSRVSNTGAASLDDRTWEDLNLDAVFTALDRTESTAGQHALYQRLRTVPAAPHLEAFDGLATLMMTDASLRERAQRALSRLADPHGYDLWWLSRADAIETRPWHLLFPVLTAATVLLAALAASRPEFLPGLIGILLVNAAVRYGTDRHIGKLSSAFRQIAPVIRAGEALTFIAGPTIDPLVGSLRTDSARLRGLKSISRWISGDPLMLPMGAGPLAVLFNDIVHIAYEYLNMAFLLDGNGVCFGARRLRTAGPALLRVLDTVGEIDAAISVASFRTERDDWTRPEFTAVGAAAILEDVCHPLVADAVPNSIALAPGRGVLITGSNMSGKSTFLRTVGVNIVMAQTLYTCLATRLSVPVFHVRSCIGRSDDLLTGRSYYLVEVESLLKLVDASTSSAPHLFLLDELFMGTNTIERIAAGGAVLDELVATPKPHVVLAATHDGELVDLVANSYEAYHFGDDAGPGGLVFDHRLRAGPAITRNAIALLRIHGAPDRLIHRAIETAATLDGLGGKGVPRGSHPSITGSGSGS